MKTKAFLTTMLVSSLTYSAFAQFNPEPAIKNRWGCAIAINSIQAQIEIPLLTNIGGVLSGTGAVIVDADGNIIARGNRNDKSYSCSIIPKYYINNDFLLRFEFGITNLSLEAKSDSKSAITHDISNTKVTTQIFRYTPGFQWIFMKKKKIESYCGLTLSYVNYNDVNISVYSESRELVTDMVQSWLKKKETSPGGFALGTGAFAGFNIYLYKYISLGAELSSSAMYYKLGGEATSENIEQVPPNPIYSYNMTLTNSYKGFKISKIISSFNISYWF